jgi:hypothetical protein
MTFRLALVAVAAATLAACGGGNPFDNPPTVENPTGSGGRKLSFAYFQKCIDPIFLATIAGAGGNNTCASSGCHDTVAGTGGALRVVPAATLVDLGDPTLTVDAIRATDMYKNFYSSQGVTVVGAPPQSRLFAKPLLLNVLHGGGQIFASQQDPNAQRIAYWITHPMPESQDEFSSAGNSLFTPPDAATGACNTQ